MSKSVSKPLPLALLASVLTCTAAQDVPAPEELPVFARQELSEDMALVGDAFHLPTVFGPTGISGWILDGVLIVSDVARGSPAEGHILPADMILEADGRPFGDEPLWTLGAELMTAEKTGRLDLTILRDGKEQSVKLPIRKLPEQGKDWPFECRNSDRILAEAVRFLAASQHPDGGFDTQTRIIYGVIGLAWLATYDPAFLENCRRLIHWYDETEQIDDPDNACWGWGYFGTFLGEYYLKTGDRGVLALCKAISARIAGSQYRCGGWGHGPVAQGALEGYNYVSGGLMNPAGVACWLALEVFDECGVKQADALAKARRYFMRFMDNGNIPYGDHYPEFNTTGNSKDALSCLALAVKGDVDAAELVGRYCTDFYKVRNHGHTGGFLGLIWGNVAGSHNPHRPDYLRMLHYWDPILHVSRRWDGAFLMPHTVTGWQYHREGPLLNTAGLALTYAVPRQGLRILGRPKGAFGTHELPPDVRQGLQLYDAGDFARLRKTVSEETEPGRQLRKAAAVRQSDINLSLRKARQALKDGNPVLARRIATGLNAMCGSEQPPCRGILRQVESERNKPVLEAARLYDEHRWLIYTRPESRHVIEEISIARDAGIYAELARDCLAVAPDDSRFQHSAALLFARYFGRNDPLSIAGSKRLATMKGLGWLQWVPLNWLREQGHVTDAFLKDWQALVPAGGTSDAGRPPPAWRTSSGSPPDNWMSPDFDDGGWATTNGPVAHATFDHIRIAFDAATTDFGTWRLYVKNDGRDARAAVYLNGACIAWIDPWRDEYLCADLVPAARRHLKQGRNVLAVRLSGSRKFDIGLYAETPEHGAEQ